MAKTPAQRKADQRKREAEHLKAVGATTFSMDMFKGTAEALERIQNAAGYEQAAELLTITIHNLDGLLKCDESRFKELTSLKAVRGGEFVR